MNWSFAWKREQFVRKLWGNWINSAYVQRTLALRYNINVIGPVCNLNWVKVNIQSYRSGYCPLVLLVDLKYCPEIPCSQLAIFLLSSHEMFKSFFDFLMAFFPQLALKMIFSHAWPQSIYEASEVMEATLKLCGDPYIETFGDNLSMAGDKQLIFMWGGLMSSTSKWYNVSGNGVQGMLSHKSASTRGC